MKATVIVTLKTGVLDPQGKAIGNAAKALGIEGIADVRQGRYFEIELDTASEAEARQRLDTLCETLLANPVIENSRYEIG